MDRGDIDGMDDMRGIVGFNMMVLNPVSESVATGHLQLERGRDHATAEIIGGIVT